MYYILKIFLFFFSVLDQQNNLDDEQSCPQDLVDFSPLYRCLHIHTVLGARNDFIEYYR